MFEFFLLVPWFWLLMAILPNAFRDHDISDGITMLSMLLGAIVRYGGILG